MSDKRSYKTIRSELDEIMNRFESSAHDDVDEMLIDHDKASKLLAELDAYLKKAEVKLQKYKAS